MDETDVIIIGAGAAGLAAGEALAAAGKSFVVLEARDRIGGRVHTVRDAHWPLPMEFGAEFIHGRPIETWDIVREKNLHVYDVTSEHWASRRGKPKKEGRDWQAMEAIMNRLDRIRASDMTFMDFLRSECADLPEAGKKMARAFVEGLDAADAEKVSAISIRQSEADGEKFDADIAFRMTDGYDRVLQAMSDRFPADAVKLNSIVRLIRWKHGRVTAELESGKTYAAERIVITLPIGVLLSGDVQFEPALPRTTAHAIDHMRMGPVVKILLRFGRSFWDDGEWRDWSFVHQPGAPFPTWWTMLPFRLPVVTGWAGGPAADAISNRPASEVLDVAISSLASIIGFDESHLRAELAAWHVSDWQADRFARGAYAYSIVGGADAATELAKPVADTLYFGGEATHPGYAGTVAAAIASGQRAAKQILKS